MVIYLVLLKPRTHLLTHGKVYIFRDESRPLTGKDWVSSGRGQPKIVDVNVTFIKTINVSNLGSLKKYVKDSGFEYPAHWITAIMNLTKKKTIDGYLYLVEVTRWR